MIWINIHTKHNNFIYPGFNKRILAILGVSERTWDNLGLNEHSLAYLGLSGRIWANLALNRPGLKSADPSGHRRRQRVRPGGGGGLPPPCLLPGTFWAKVGRVTFPPASFLVPFLPHLKCDVFGAKFGRPPSFEAPRGTSGAQTSPKQH